MKFGLVLDCTEAAGQAVWAYLEALGISPTEIIASDGTYTGRCQPPVFVTEKQGRYTFYAPKRGDIGYDSFLVYGGEVPEKPLCRSANDRLRGDRLCVMVSFLRRCGCERVIVALDRRPIGNPPQNCRMILLPPGLCPEETIKFLHAAEQNLLPMLLLE